jgi:hypothetical protein
VQGFRRPARQGGKCSADRRETATLRRGAVRLSVTRRISRQKHDFCAARSSADLDPAVTAPDQALGPAAAGLAPAPDRASGSAAADPDSCLLSLSCDLGYPPRPSLKRVVVCPGLVRVGRRHGCSSSSPPVARCARCGRLRFARPVVPADSRARPLGARLPDRVGRNRSRSRSPPVVRPLVVAGQREVAYRGGGFRAEPAALVFQRAPHRAPGVRNVATSLQPAGSDCCILGLWDSITQFTFCSC